jgi:hypothetical protein
LRMPAKGPVGASSSHPCVRRRKGSGEGVGRHLLLGGCGWERDGKERGKRRAATAVVRVGHRRRRASRGLLRPVAAMAVSRTERAGQWRTIRLGFSVSGRSGRFCPSESGARPSDLIRRPTANGAGTSRPWAEKDRAAE